MKAVLSYGQTTIRDIIFLLLVCIGCNQKEEANLERLRQEIIHTDLAMSDLAAREGFNNSIFNYADSNIVKLNEGYLPIIGKTAFEASYDKERDVKTISWIPVNAEVAKSGELGYSWGNWKFSAKDTVWYGNYFTIWKKHKDGSWKVLLDGGNSTPNPGY